WPLTLARIFRSRQKARVASGNLIGVAPPQNLDRSLEQDREIEPEAPVVNVPEVIFDASLDQGRCGRSSPEPMDLRPTGQSRFDALAEGVVPNDLVELAVVWDGMGARSRQGHAAFENIEQLGRFVDASPSQPFANAGYTAVDRLCLNNRRPVLHDQHG